MFQRTVGEDDDPQYPLSGGEVPARDCGPLTWSRVGRMNSYNLIIRPNSFIQMWFSKAGSKQVTHVQTDYVDMEGNATRVMGAKTKEEGRSLGALGARPLGGACATRWLKLVNTWLSVLPAICATWINCLE